MDLQFEDSFTFGVGRIFFSGGWYRVDAPVQSIKIDNHKVIITTPCINFTHHIDTVPLFPDIVELRRGVIDMDFGATHCPMRRGLNSIVFEVVEGSFDKYGVAPDEAPATEAAPHASGSQRDTQTRQNQNQNQNQYQRQRQGQSHYLRARCGHCLHDSSIQRGRHIRFGPNGAINELDDSSEIEEEKEEKRPYLGPARGIVNAEDVRPQAPPVPAALRTVVVAVAPMHAGVYESRHGHRDHYHAGGLNPMEFMSDAITVTEAQTNEECVICRCSYEVGEEKRWLPCFHAFHAPCIDRWVYMDRDDGQAAAQCPICKTALDDHDLTTRHVS